MISNWLFIVLIILLSMVAYFIGLTRGITGSQHLYDDGWTDCEEYFKRFPELLEGEEEDEDRYDKARELIHQLDELFEEDEDEDNVIDCGEY